MKRLLIITILLIGFSVYGSTDPFSAEFEAPEVDRFFYLKSRVNSNRVITKEEIECFPEDISVNEVIDLFGVEAAVAPEIPFLFVYPREGKPRSTKEEKYRYGYYFWPHIGDGELEESKILCVSFFPKEPKGEFLSEEWLDSHEIIWPESKKGAKMRDISPLHNQQTK